jgi:hypothetical protein
MDDKLNINEIFENAMKDPSLFSTLDIDKLLDSIENVKNDYLENTTMKEVTLQLYTTLKDLGLSQDKITIFCEKLIGYRYVDQVNEIQKGKHIRWIRMNNDMRLTSGGIVVNVKFLDNGTHITCMGPGNRFIQYKFDDCITFQKLSMEEQLILMAYDNM